MGGEGVPRHTRKKGGSVKPFASPLPPFAASIPHSSGPSCLLPTRLMSSTHGPGATGRSSAPTRSSWTASSTCTSCVSGPRGSGGSSRSPGGSLRPTLRRRLFPFIYSIGHCPQRWCLQQTNPTVPPRSQPFPPSLVEGASHHPSFPKAAVPECDRAPPARVLARRYIPPHGPVVARAAGRRSLTVADARAAAAARLGSLAPILRLFSGNPAFFQRGIPVN